MAQRIISVVGKLAREYLSLDMGGAMFTVSPNQYVGATFTLPGHPTAYTVVSHGVATTGNSEPGQLRHFPQAGRHGSWTRPTVRDNTELTPQR